MWKSKKLFYLTYDVVKDKKKDEESSRIKWGKSIEENRD